MNQNENSQTLNLKYKQEARRLFNDKNYEEALKFYEKSIENKESDPEQQIQYICQCLAKLGKFEELQKQYELYYQKHKDDITLFNLVLLNCQLFKFDNAEEYHQKLKKDFISNIYIESQVIIYFYQRKYQEAEEELKKIGDEYLDDFMLYILLGQIQFITQKEVISIQQLKNQQLHIILKAIIQFNDLPDHIIQQQLKYDKIRQQFYQDIKQKQINSQYFDIKRYAYFEPFEQEFLSRQSQPWGSSISKQINYFHQCMGKLTLAQQKYLIIYNNKKYQKYFSDMITVFNEYSNLSQHLKELIQFTELDSQQLEYVKIKFSTLEHQSLTENEIQEIIEGIDEAIEERIQFIGDQNGLEYVEKKKIRRKQQLTKQIDNFREEMGNKDLYKIRQGTIDSYIILFMRQRNRLQLDKDIVRDQIKFSLIKIFKRP
ncbi:hypothetical protein pb186bvf_003503 [Paramecium bursaria]